jgi:hypothetical protein
VRHDKRLQLHLPSTGIDGNACKNCAQIIQVKRRGGVRGSVQTHLFNVYRSSDRLHLHRTLRFLPGFYLNTVLKCHKLGRRGSDAESISPLVSPSRTVLLRC